ncbi:MULTISPECIES: tRNA (guanosine(46)-N7)-methyltransferase TrmB [unclassified Sporosarcina]|uniref:tRNA (guanosine(46)-N7)-methyltransferase TrmB n=1 Tax=unclassified Sporosarcina TaxID=2647733 RepID=UPI002041E1A2|nr:MULTISPECIES: tRNA (guanosine(46)-N7)-methyltransferase TrmB [unclassified Sporosarcina]GKV64767.1 tRNA (guanine-N(7)-)-methyltransferase [Sporosarcina sp. NCCP-2331]GLB54877.1 tRNA (guanine-N(7)-)-methyltransferase [Sporosarcina sp. NCCP-2378]
MRLRNKPWAKDFMAEHPDMLIMEPESSKGKWAEVFGNDSPIHIEVGTGKGQFVIGMALANPETNYIGIEHFDNVVVSALEKAIEKDKPKNLRLLRANGADLESIFEMAEIDRVYLNFSDPWPKTRHEKRRLTHESFLQKYEGILKPGGEIHFKTDNRSLFEYSLVSMTDYGMKLLSVSLDLHANMPEDNVLTEYEEKFSSKGQPIYRMEAQYQNVK